MARFKNEKGYSLNEVTMAIAAAAVLTLAVTQVFNWVNKTSFEARTLAQLEILRTVMLKNLESESSWMRTIAANPEMACLAKDAVTACTTTAPKSFVLMDSKDSKIYDPAKGITFNGAPCDGFSEDKHSPLCPLRFDLKWQVVCENSFCTTIVNAPLLQTKNLGFTVNLARYSINNFLVPNYDQICPQKTQQVFLYSLTGSTMSGSFTIPPYAKKLVVELRGGGGGAGAINGPFGGINNGGWGGESWFGNAGFKAAGGAPGGGPAGGSLLICNTTVMAYGSGPTVGQNAPEATPGLLSDVVAGNCTPPNTNASTAGKGIPFAYANGGIYSAGGTGSIGHIYTGGAPCMWGAYTSGAGYAGAYSYKIFNPSTLPPGSNVSFQIGAGGVGAYGVAWFYAYNNWFATPNKGGNGAPGMIKITWE